jgi:hypothetical protein
MSAWLTPQTKDRRCIQRGRQVAERIGQHFAGAPAEEIEREAVKAGDLPTDGEG